MTYVSKYYSLNEFSCRCGCDEQPQDTLKELADLVRQDWDGPLIVSSGKRCSKHNKKIGGAPKSAHVVGLAVDLRPADIDRMAEFHKFCESKLEEWQCRMEDPAVTANWTHLDLYPVGPSGRVFKP